jgi:PAS domain S-box-containing protein
LAALESLFEALDDVVFCVKNHQRRYVSVNRAFARRVGRNSARALIGRTARELFPPLLAAGYEQQDDQVFTTGQEIRDRLEMVTNPDGTTGWYLAQKVPVRNGAGDIVALAGISRDLRSPLGSDPKLAPIASVIERIRRDFAEPIRIRDLAAEAGLSMDSLERGTRVILGISPRQFLTKTRVENAARTLRAGKIPIGQIASECGFYDQAMFSRQFSATTGLTPRQYREAALK